MCRLSDMRLLRCRHRYGACPRSVWPRRWLLGAVAVDARRVTSARLPRSAQRGRSDRDCPVGDIAEALRRRGRAAATRPTRQRRGCRHRRLLSWWSGGQGACWGPCFKRTEQAGSGDRGRRCLAPAPAVWSTTSTLLLLCLLARESLLTAGLTCPSAAPECCIARAEGQPLPRRSCVARHIPKQSPDAA
jgi:hypothetical protein